MDMRKTIIAAGAVIYLFAGGLYAANIKLIGPCFEKPVLEKDFKIKDFKDNAVKISDKIFKDNGILYEGNDDGFTSILGAPSGADAMEHVSHRKMRVYGWCFTVNGVLPEVMPGDFYFNKASDRIVWFYGYSTYDKGQWKDYCAPSYKIKSPYVCSDLSKDINSELAADIKPDLSKSLKFGASVYKRLVDFSAELWQ